MLLIGYTIKSFCWKSILFINHRMSEVQEVKHNCNCSAKLTPKQKLLIRSITLKCLTKQTVYFIFQQMLQNILNTFVGNKRNEVQRKLKRSSEQVCAVSFYIPNIISCSAYLCIPIPFIGWLVIWLGSFQGRHFIGV